MGTKDKAYLTLLMISVLILTGTFIGSGCNKELLDSDEEVFGPGEERELDYSQLKDRDPKLSEFPKEDSDLDTDTDY